MVTMISFLVLSKRKYGLVNGAMCRGTVYKPVINVSARDELIRL
jgi:hypothetical protein